MRLGRRAQPQGRDVLLDHVLLTIDGERQEIASRLHDGPQQLMTAIRLLADGAQHALETGRPSRPAARWSGCSSWPWRRPTSCGA